MQISRRSLLGSLGALIVAPAIVRASSLMSIRPFEPVSLLSTDTVMAELDAILIKVWDNVRMYPTHLIVDDSWVQAWKAAGITFPELMELS